MTGREVLVPPDEKPALAAMMADYIAEMEEIIGGPRLKTGYPFFDLYWSEPETRWPFWLKAGDKNAGFALLRREVDAGRMQIAEFFVAMPHRRAGVGLAAARRLIGRFPGPWRITQRENNAAAIAFWHRVLDGFAIYDEMTTTTDKVRREQRFTIAGPARS